MKLLLVEDEELLSKVITKGLKKCGYAVDNAFNGEDALMLYEINNYDLIVLDLNLPKLDGLDVLKKIRELDNVMKVLILSARSEIDDRVLGLDIGANDYLIKPFDFAELEARIRNLVRRSFVQTPTVFQCGQLKLDTASKTIFIEKQPIVLTKKEYSIIEYLMLHIGSVISSEELIEHVWDSEVDLFSNSLKYHMFSLKKKLGGTELIKNIRGQGYIIQEETENVQ